MADYQNINQEVNQQPSIVHPVIVILGPTACGKTKLAAQLAFSVGAEIVSADSRQVYRGMDIGTGKDLDEYTVQNQAISYHLINVADAGDSYHIHRFQQEVNEALKIISANQKRAILCGGSGMYIEAVLKQYQFTAIPIDNDLRQNLMALTDEQLLMKFDSQPSIYSSLADTSTRKRRIRAIEINQFLANNPNFELPAATVIPAVVFGLDLPVELRRQRISHRLHQRLREGMIEEVKALLDSGIDAKKLIFYGLEYKLVTQYLTGELNYGTMIEQLEVAIHQFAKRQMTFFRKMERNGLKIIWLDAQKSLDELVTEIKTQI